MKLCGIDYSLTCPAITVFEGDKFSHLNCQSYYLIDTPKYVKENGNFHGHQMKPYSSPMERYENIATWALSIVENSNFVGIEDYSMGSRGKVFHIAENTAILKYLLTKKGIPYRTYPPTQIKKFAIKGNADKTLMYSAYIKDTRIDLRSMMEYKGTKVGSPVSDIVDSYFITKYLYKDLENSKNE